MIRLGNLYWISTLPEYRCQLRRYGHRDRSVLWTHQVNRCAGIMRLTLVVKQLQANALVGYMKC